MKKLLSLICLGALLNSGCSTVKVAAYNVEIDNSKEQLEKPPERVEKGELTQKQADKIKEVLLKIIDRAKRLKAENEG